MLFKELSEISVADLVYKVPCGVWQGRYHIFESCIELELSSESCLKSVCMILFIKSRMESGKVGIRYLVSYV